MGFDLGLMAAAYKGYKAADKEARDEEFLKATRDYQLANAQESADLRPDRMAAQKGAYGLQTAQSAASTDLLPAQTADTRGRLDLAAQQRTAAGQLIPGATANALTEQKAKAADLEFADAQRPITQTIQSIKNRNQKFEVDAEAQQLPDRLQQQVTGNILKTEDAKGHLIGTAGAYLDSGDKDSAIALFQRAFDRTTLFPQARGSKLQDIQKVENPDGTWHARFLDDQGGIIADIPSKQFARAYDMTLGKKDVQKLGPGEIAVGIHNGKATKLFENTNTRDGTRGAGSRNGATAEMKTVRWLTGGDPDYPIAEKDRMSVPQAQAWVKQSKAKSRAQFLADAVAKDSFWGAAKPEKKKEIESNYSRLYDSLREQDGGLSDASNSGATPKIDTGLIDSLTSGGTE